MTLASAFPDGLGNSLGDSLGVNAPFYSTGLVWYVHSGTGTNAAAPAGRNRAKPLATLAQAQTNASNGDTIVLLDGHAQTFTATLTISKALLIVGEGESDGKPTVKLTPSSASSGVLQLAAAAEVRNVWFEENLQANDGIKLSVAVAGCRVVGCYFECGALDDGEALQVASTNCHIKNTTLVSTATLTSAQPYVGLTASGACDGLYLEGVVLDGGSVGFANHWAMDFNTATFGDEAPALIEGLSLLRGADVLIPASGANIKIVGPITVSGGSVIDWNGGGGE